MTKTLSCVVFNMILVMVLAPLALAAAAPAPAVAPGAPVDYTKAIVIGCSLLAVGIAMGLGTSGATKRRR